MGRLTLIRTRAFVHLNKSACRQGCSGHIASPTCPSPSVPQAATVAPPSQRNEMRAALPALGAIVDAQHRNARCWERPNTFYAPLICQRAGAPAPRRDLRRRTGICPSTPLSGMHSAMFASCACVGAMSGTAVSGILFYVTIVFAVSCSFGWLTRAARRCVSASAEASTQAHATTQLTWLQ
jgi:hypothetical protein